MHDNVYAMFSRTYEILNLLNQREEQTLIAFISLKDYNDASWAYNGRNKDNKTPKSNRTQASHERILFGAI